MRGGSSQSRIELPGVVDDCMNSDAINVEVHGKDTFSGTILRWVFAGANRSIRKH
ncbi:MAG: hypothetical protein AAB495_00725 [Patescibacteria group bacterium]